MGKKKSLEKLKKLEKKKKLKKLGNKKKFEKEKKWKEKAKLKKYVLGIDVGGTTCKLGIFEVEGKLVDKWEIPTDTTEHGSKILENVADSIFEKLRDKSIEIAEVLGVGIGIPGTVKKGGIVERNANLGWENVNVEEELSAKMHLPVRAGNDANVAALGEMWQGGAKGFDNILMVTLGTGVGGAVIVDGKMLSGSHGAGGEIGHMTVNKSETLQCGCGQYGCLEQYTSATGIVRMANRKSYGGQANKEEKLTAKAVLDAAKAGEESAVEVVEEVCEILGQALSNVACVSDPDIILIGGGVSKAGDYLVDCIRKHYKANAFFACENVKFALAELGNDAGIYGGAYMALDK